MDAPDARRLKALGGDENSKLKRLLNRCHAGQHRAEGSALKKMVRPAAKREAVAHLREQCQGDDSKRCGRNYVDQSQGFAL